MDVEKYLSNPQPICPHCDDVLVDIASSEYTTQEGDVAVITCSSCRGEYICETSVEIRYSTYPQEGWPIGSYH